MGSPDTGCMTFGRALFMRVPCPAARTMAVVVFIGGLFWQALSGGPGYNLPLALEAFMRTRASLGRVLGIFVPIVVGGFGAACSNDFDTSRTLPPRGTLGEELYGVVCDRAGGQSLHEDLSGASYAGICHRQADGTFSSTGDQSLLP